MHIRQLLLNNKKNRPALRSSGGYKIENLKGIVIHWTGNTDTGAGAVANRNYFNSGVRAASAHYIVDDMQVVQCIPDDEMAWHVGDTPRPNAPARPVGLEKPNSCLIGIEMCVNANGDWVRVYDMTVRLTKQLLKKYDLTVEDVYRHYDITGKNCPLMLLPIETSKGSFDWNWMLFKQALIEEHKTEEIIVYKDKEVAKDYSVKELLLFLFSKLRVIWPWVR